MDNERPNERTWWGRRLEEPGALPGTGLTDKEAAWDKLYDRLKDVRKTGRRGNIARFPERANDGPSDNELEARFGAEAPRRKRMIWLWAAAACLLLIVIPTALLLKDRNPGHDPKPIPVAVSSGKERSTPQDKLSSPTPVIANPPQPASGQRVNQGKDMAATRPRPATEKAAPTHPAPAPPTRPAPIRPDLNKLLAHGADTLTLVFAPRPDLSKPLTAAAATPPKKAQRVVHINELESPQPTPATVRGPRQKPGGLRFGFVPENSFRPSTTYAAPEAHQILSLDEPLVRSPKARH
ncbi:MAG TPA: hypothetical protein VHC96_22545 [Puia sp.]|nr:hypothetical protein [Puia sp.]